MRRKNFPKWLVPIAIALGAALLLAISSQETTTPDGLPILRDMEQYDATLRQAESLSKERLIRYDSGKPLSADDMAQLRKAARLFDTLNVFAPTKMGPYFISGKIYSILGEPELAEQRLRQSIANAPLDKDGADPNALRLTTIEARYLLALLAMARNDFQTGYREANLAVTAVPTSANYLAARARAEIQLRRLPEARRDLEKALRLDPDHPASRSLMEFLNSSSP